MAEEEGGKLGNKGVEGMLMMMYSAQKEKKNIKGSKSMQVGVIGTER